MEEAQITPNRQISLQDRLFGNRLEQLGYTCSTIHSEHFTTIRVIPVENNRKQKTDDYEKEEMNKA